MAEDTSEQLYFDQLSDMLKAELWEGPVPEGLIPIEALPLDSELAPSWLQPPSPPPPVDRSRNLPDKRPAKKRRRNVEDEALKNYRLFMESYNSLYWQKIPDTWRQNRAWVQQMLATMNSVQQRLIQNLALPKISKQFGYIEGPTHFSIYNAADANNMYKTFYLFGENHKDLESAKGRCVKRLQASPDRVIAFADFISLMAKNTTQFLDIYMEVEKFSAEKNYRLYSNQNTWFKYSLFPALLNQFNVDPQVPLFATYTQFLHTSLPGTVDFATHTDSLVLLQLLQRFSDCFDPSKRGSNADQCALARFHYIDVRTVINTDNVNSFQFYLDIVLEFINIVSPNQFYDMYKPIYSQLHFMMYKPAAWSKLTYVKHFVFNVLRSFGVYSFMETLVAADDFRGITALDLYLSKDPKLDEKINKSTLSGFIKPFVANTLDEQHSPEDVRNQWTIAKLFEQQQDAAATENDFESLLNFEEKLKKEESDYEAFMSFCQFLYKYLFNLTAAVVDLYCLSRVFKKFSHDPLRPLEQPEYPSTYIIYSGDYHTQVYEKFIEYLIDIDMLAFTKPEYNDVTRYKGKKVMCVRLPNLDDIQDPNLIPVRTRTSVIV
jgi:hypothetical protein